MRVAALHDFCELLQGGRHKLSGKNFVASGYPAFGAGGLNGYLPEPEFTQDGVVLSAIGARCGKCFLAEGEWSSLANTQVIFPDPKKADIRFLWYQLNDEGRWPRRGLAQPFIRPSDVKAHQVYFPPLDEQRRIAGILDKADALRRKRKCALDLLDSLTQSIFLEMFGSETKGETCQLSDLVDASDRINYGVVQPGEDEPDGIFLVRVSDLEHGRVNHSSLRKVSKQTNKKHGRSVLKGNEILISCVGSIGEIALTSDAERGFNIARAVARVPVDDELIRNYVAEYLRTPKAQEYFTKELRTVSQPTLNIKQIPHQSELREFKRRVRLTDLGLKLARVHKSRTDFLFSSLRSRAFSGHL